ncbi:MAG TPA: ATP-binding protein [Thermoleophilaceae bacterium]
MRLPIQLRLTAWYVGLLALVIVALGAFVAVRLRADLTADTDHSLRSSAAQIRSSYERAGTAGFTARSATVLRVLPGDSGAQLVTADGALARVLGPDVPRSALITAAEARAAMAGRELLKTAHGRSDNEPFRVFATGVGHDGERSALVVASSLEGVDSAVHRVIVLLLLAGPVVLLIAGLGGRLIARRALSPVARVTEQAERIELDRLDERVPVPPTSDEIARLAVTLNRMLERLDRGVQEKRQLVADASHELRTPLAVMRSELDVALAYGALEPEAARVLASAREEVERMTWTVDNLLTLATVDEGHLELLKRDFPLRRVVDDVVAELAPVAADRGVTVSAEGDRGVVAADRDRIRQVLANLVDNAVKHSPEGGEVRIAVWEEPGEARLSVADDGPGIPEAALPYVFDRFYRVDAARKHDDGGSGLGLAICREIVAAHGGSVWAESQPGRGSTFHVSLPAGGPKSFSDSSQVDGRTVAASN